MKNFLGQNLKTIRILKGMSQAELAGKMNKTQKSIGNWETGYSEPCTDELIRISEIFQLSIDQLLKQEIKTNLSKARVPRNRTKDGMTEPEFVSPNVSDIKKKLMEETKKEVPHEAYEIIWRDGYIAALEKQVGETNSSMPSEKYIQSLVKQVFALKQIVSEFTGISS